MTNIILHKNSDQMKQKRARKNLNMILKMKTKLFLLERQIQTLSKTSPIDAYFSCNEFLNIKKEMQVLEILVTLSNKLMLDIEVVEKK